ncbi:MAG: hypothetical protein KDA68_18430 [Planctomycetaceae bacterium]|nr:hypothetical protein [Planctomycetaceae bacterium]
MEERLIDFDFELKECVFDRKAICLLVEAAERWVLEWDAGHKMGKNFDILYKLNEGRYLSLSYWYCERKPFPEIDPPLELWTSFDPPLGGFISACEASEILAEHGAAVPDSMRAAADAEREAYQKLKASRQIRDPEHWRGKGFRSFEAAKPAHTVDTLDLTERVLQQAVTAVREIHQENGQSSNHRFPGFTDLCADMFRPYPVDPKHWWGSQEGFPPATVSLKELNWPEDSTKLQKVVAQLFDLLDPFAAFFDPRVTLFGHPDYPTIEETDLAHQKLLGLLPVLQETIVSIQKRLTELQRERKKKDGNLPCQSKRPSDDAFWLYRLWAATGLSQTALAKRFQKENRKPMTQGQVSRQIDAVNEWLATGNLLPDTQPLREITSLDPREIEMGARRDGRTPLTSPQ